MQDYSAQLRQLLSELTLIMLNPASNPRAAYLLYGAIALILLIALTIGIMVLLNSAKEEKGGPAGAAGPRRARPSRPPASPSARLAVVTAVALMLLAAWVIAGYTTSKPALCRSCHWPAAEHAKAGPGTDPHAGASCVSCHEPGAALGRYFTGVPARLIHFLDSQSSVPQLEEYGRVTVAACSSCHSAELVGVATNERRGLKVSHEEPLSASATCIDCHALRSGVVGLHNTGMAPCMRCHGTKLASAACSTCHDEKAASAARARTASFADVQIPNVSCGGCHDEKRECDSCHGLRLPHTAEFKAYAHSRAGAVDLWYNGGKTCSRCHTASRRPCQVCHGTLLGRAHGTGLARGHQRAAPSACNRCHLTYAYFTTRDFCKDLCHAPASVAASPR